MPPVSPPCQPEPFAPHITLDLRDDVLPPGPVDVEEDANNEEDDSYLQEDAKYMLIILSAHS